MPIVLALFAHPDDEVLGCGATLAKHVEASDTVHARFVGNGVGSRGDTDPTRRLREAGEAAAALGLASWAVHTRPPDDQKFDMEPQLGVNQRVESFIADTKPTVIYTHSPHDLNRDHRIVYEAVMVATRPWKYAPCLVLGCGIQGGAHEYAPVKTVRLDARHMEVALHALTKYASERNMAPLPRSRWATMSRAMADGADAGVWYAQTFEVLRWVE